jgi:hypothetical protein
MPPSELDLDAIWLAARNASDGPWEIEREELSVDFTDEEQESAYPTHVGPIPIGDDCDDGEQLERDIAFVKLARDVVAPLVDELRTLRRHLAAALDVVHAARTHHDGPDAECADCSPLRAALARFDEVRRG